MILFVVDASVIAKWILPGEPDQEIADQIKRDHVAGRSRLCAPSLLIQEVTNSIWKAVKLKRLSLNDGQEALEALSDMQLDLRETNWTEASQILKIAITLNLTAYDAQYILLSEKLKATLITADQKLFEAAKGKHQVQLMTNHAR